MIARDMNKIDVAVHDKVREYYRTDKKLGGLIKVFVSEYTEKFGREVRIFIPTLEKQDEVYINGMRFTPATQSRKDTK